MKFSYNWLRDYVDGLDLPPAKLESLITMKTAECEGIETVGAYLADACAALVESVEPIRDSHSVIAQVDTGRYGHKTVVCGAPNCRPGVVTVYVPLAKKFIHGMESDGMLASGAELGINRDAAGVIELDSPIGAAIPGCSPDSVIEIDNKSITHRPDLWGHLGMGREVAAISHQRLLDPVKMDRIPRGDAAICIAIENLDLCPRYSALVFDNVTVRPSPPWLQYRLTSIGLNPINNLVDLTNFLMAELPQPMHAFDRHKLRGGTIFIRPAKAGERVVALNEEEYTLQPANLVIADEGGAVAIAGVIGGLETAITDETTSIVLESANFQAASVRRTSGALKLRTDASMRFEKSQDPATTVRALARAVELLEELSPGARLVGGLCEQKKDMPPPAPIMLPVDWLIRKLGRDIAPDEARDILQRLAFGVTEATPRVFSVTVPSWRATKDVSVRDDLVEEVGRMVGYDSITPAPPAILATPPPHDEERVFHRAARAMFAAQGFAEVSNYSFSSEEQVRLFGFDPDAHVRVANPIASDQTLMRISLIPGIYRNLVENSKHFDHFRLFEIGREIHKQTSGLPREVAHLAAAIYSKQPNEADLFELKRAAECLLPGIEARPDEAHGFEHPARAAKLFWRSERVGRLAELYPSLLTGRAALLDLDLQRILELRSPEKKYTPLRRFPESQFDLSVIAASRELVGALQNKLTEFAGELLEHIEFVRLYSGAPLPENTKSVSFRLTVAAPDRTLSSEEVGAVRTRIIDGMRLLGYELRV